MNSEITKRWIEAGKNIAVNPNAKVLCPVCQKAYLEVKDIKNANNPSEIERHMICPECGAHNALKLTR